MGSCLLLSKLDASVSWQGILISGPPGTGKTLLARAIARESGLPFVFASGAEFVESSTGNGSDKIFDIFFTARANVSISRVSNFRHNCNLENPYDIYIINQI